MAEIVNPELYLSGYRPQAVRLAVGGAAPDGFKCALSATWGLNAAVELVIKSEQHVAPTLKVAKAWDGGRVELWRKGAGECEGTCADRALAVVGSTWRTPQAAKAYAAVVTKSLQEREAEPAGPGAFTLGGGGVAIAADGKELTMAWAPEARQARQLAERSQR